MAKLLQDWVAVQAEQRPEATAVVMGQERMTYAEVDARSTQLARILKEKGISRNDRVCLLMPKSPAALLAILGVLKADAMYVPLDPQSPAARLARIIDSCEPRWLLAGGGVEALLEEILRAIEVRCSVAVGWMGPDKAEGENFRAEFSATDFASYPIAPLDSRNRSEDAAHILFTSGSTGMPKGVVITHSSVIHFVDWATAYFDIGPGDRNSGHSPLHFDLSTFDIFGTFAAGAELHLVRPELNILPNRLADFIRGSELTQWFSVPSILNHMAKFNVVAFHDFPALKRLLWCGEVFPTPALMCWMKRLPHVTFTNLYGPTEATIASSFYTVPSCPEDERAPIPIGTACAGEELLVLDESLRPVPPGEVGDLYIRGVGLSAGYWRDQEKTREAFLPNPNGDDPTDRIYKTGDLAKVGPDGLVYLLGRTDSQIKCRGYRIELGEIEAALNAIAGVQECAVVALPTDGFEGTVICCAYLPVAGADINPVALRRELSGTLPSYMLPTRWLAFEQFPKNPNGKTDRRRLKEAFEAHADRAT